MKHLEDIGETYWEHFKFAFRFGFVLFLTGVLVMVHAICPSVLKNIGSDVVNYMHGILEERKSNDE